jgi:hypothetical protein
MRADAVPEVHVATAIVAVTVSETTVAAAMIVRVTTGVQAEG